MNFIQFTVVFFLIFAHSVEAQQSNKLTLENLKTSQELESTLEKLSTDYKSTDVDDNLKNSVPAEMILKPSAPNPPIGASGGRARKPDIPIPNTVIIKFENSASESEILDFLNENELEAVDWYSKTGQVKAIGDLSAHFDIPAESDGLESRALLKGMAEISRHFRSDHRVKSVIADFSLSNQNSERLSLPPIVASPTEVVPVSEIDGEIDDWGIEDIKATTLFDNPAAHNAVTVAVIDTDFDAHSDLALVDNYVSIRDSRHHGNHVCGIVCAKHNGIGTRGVVPNCNCLNKSGLKDGQLDESPYWNQHFLFSKFITAMNEVIQEEESVKAINISLGFHHRWFGIDVKNPELTPEEFQDYEEIIKSSAFQIIGQYAELVEHGVPLFLAAGNDSQSYSDPIHAKYSGPFTYAADMFKPIEGSELIVVVEAHDIDGNKIMMSNVAGDLSCPGMDVISTIGRPESNLNDPLSTFYGLMTGTSMAAPYCTGAYVRYAAS